MVWHHQRDCALIALDCQRVVAIRRVLHALLHRVLRPRSVLRPPQLQIAAAAQWLAAEGASEEALALRDAVRLLRGRLSVERLPYRLRTWAHMPCDCCKRV